MISSPITIAVAVCMRQRRRHRPPFSQTVRRGRWSNLSISVGCLELSRPADRVGVCQDTAPRWAKFTAIVADDMRPARRRSEQGQPALAGELVQGEVRRLRDQGAASLALALLCRPAGVVAARANSNLCPRARVGTVPLRLPRNCRSGDVHARLLASGRDRCGRPGVGRWSGKRSVTGQPASSPCFGADRRPVLHHADDDVAFSGAAALQVPPSRRDSSLQSKEGRKRTAREVRRSSCQRCRVFDAPACSRPGASRATEPRVPLGPQSGTPRPALGHRRLLCPGRGASRSQWVNP